MNEDLTLHESPLADRAIDLVREWVEAPSGRRAVEPAARRLAELLADPHGLDFTIGFVDRVIRPEDPVVAAHNLRELARDVPAFLPASQRMALRWGARFSRMFPGFVVSTAATVLRRMVGHLVVDARPEKLGRTIETLRTGGDRLNLNLLGEAVMGDAEAGRRRDATIDLLRRDDVDYVSVKVSGVASHLSLWAFDETVDRVVAQLVPVYATAASGTTHKFVNLDMEEYRDLDLTVAVFTRALEKFPNLEAGIVLQAYLPDALGALDRLHTWAYERRLRGGAPVKVRVVKGANLAMERVDAAVHGWPLATWGSKAETDASYKRVLDRALRPDRVDAVRIGIAGQNLFDLAWAWLLAEDRGVTDAVDVEMLLGMDAGPVRAVRRTVGRILLYTPVVHPDEFDVAIAYLVRRLEENASSENFMSAVFRLADDPAAFEREAGRFQDSLRLVAAEVPPTHRVQDRSTEHVDPAAATTGFSNTPDTDPAIAANRAWGRAVLERSTYTQLGLGTIEESHIHGPASLETVVRQARAAADRWQERDPQVRSWLLHQAGHALGRRRGDLVAVMAAEAGKTIAQADVEVSEAIDFAHYYAELAKKLDQVDGARFVPSKLTVVTPPWNFPVAIPAGSALSALAAGSGVVIKPAAQARRSGAVMVEAIWEALDEAGIGREILQYVQLSERDLGTALVSHPAVDRLILTGGYETAQLFRSFRQDLPLLAETSGKNALIVTPSADLDLAARDVAQSAFGHAGQKCSAASLVVLVGSVATSRRFHHQLVDAVRSLKVGYPVDPQTQMGPIIEPAGGKLLRGLTELGEGEKWELQPRRLDGTGKLWSPGLRYGVRRGSEYHLTEYFGPILGVMTAATLEEAVEMVNEVDYGLTSGLHSLDPDELGYWLENIQAGNLYVNRGITGAIVRRQPFGGWKKSAVGAGTKAGGPNYLVGLGSWKDAPAEASPAPATVPSGAPARLLDAVRSATVGGSAGLDTNDADWLAGALASDAAAWRSEFGVAKDVSGLQAERNIFRYRPVPVTVRYEAGTSGRGVAELVRVASAGLRAWDDAPAHAAGPGRAGARITVSTGVELPESVAGALRTAGVVVAVEDTAEWAARAARLAERTGPASAARIRLIGAPVAATAAATGGKPDVALYANDVVSAGRVELLTFLHEQAVSITAHRFGTPNHLSDTLI